MRSSRRGRRRCSGILAALGISAAGVSELGFSGAGLVAAAGVPLLVCPLAAGFGGLAGEALVGSGQFGAQADDGGGLLVGLCLSRAQFRLECDFAVADAAAAGL